MDVQQYLELGLVHSIHTSERKSFRGCRRRWNWVYRDGFYPKTTARPLEFGVAFHKAMEVWYDPEFWEHPDHNLIQESLAKIEFKKTTLGQFQNYRKLNGEPDTEIKADYQDRVDLGLKMIEYYCTKVSPALDIGFKPIAVEVPFEVPLPDLWCRCDRCWKKYTTVYNIKYETWHGLPVTYGGRIDMLAVDNNDRAWIFDWKTTSRILDEDAESAFLQLDDQVGSYCAALHKLDRPVAGFVYHEQRKGVPEIPTQLNRLYKGRAFSTARNANTDYRTFKRHVFEYDREALEYGCYDEYLTWLQTEGPKFYQRHQIHKNRHEIENTWLDLIEEAKDIIGQPRIYPQPGRFSCNTCAYRVPCTGQNMGEDYQYALDTLFVKKDKHYYETEESRTE